MQLLPASFAAAVSISPSWTSASTAFAAFLLQTWCSLMCFMIACESIASVSPSSSSAAAYCGNRAFRAASLDPALVAAVHFDPHAASASRTARAVGADIFWKNSALAPMLSTAREMAASRWGFVICARPRMSIHVCSLTIDPSMKTSSSTSPFTPAGSRNSATLIGSERVITPFASYSPRLRRTPSASRRTAGLPAYDFFPPAIGSFPIV
mmetsp:Transcript_52211/g.117281  ORF Transcript_52211/g.117281 Transcript_52211/m.117281 type:complete len:210 (-) Transcript_52211:2329-2958(-)